MNKLFKKSKCRSGFMFLILSLFLISTISAANTKPNLKKVKVLVYTKKGKGYVHDNIADAVKGVQKLGKDNGFKVDVSDDPAVYTDENLKQYTMLIFPSTNNDVFDTDAQRLAFRRYIEAGGGFVGVHSVTGTERNWKWFKMMLGGTFSWHANFQKFTVKMLNSKHPSMQGLPAEWVREDECYFAKEMYPGPTPLMAHDVSTLKKTDTAQNKLIQKNLGNYSELYPSVWAYDFDGGHTWCTVLGHDKKDYADPIYTKHLLQGIQFVASQFSGINYSKAYAVDRDTPVKF